MAPISSSSTLRQRPVAANSSASATDAAKSKKPSESWLWSTAGAVAGMQDFSFVSWSTAPQPPIDLDVHEIPARREEPAHLHWDLRFLLQAAPGQTLTVSDESNELAWAPLAALGAYTQEESVLRMHRKAQEVRSCP